MLITWSAAVLAGLYMLAGWLIENDVTAGRPRRADCRYRGVRPCDLSGDGAGPWVAYLVADQENLAWASIGVLGGIALLGFTMFARWSPVYRDPVPAAGPARGGQSAGPAESNFPWRSSPPTGCSPSQRSPWPS